MCSQSRIKGGMSWMLPQKVILSILSVAGGVPRPSIPEINDRGHARLRTEQET